MLGVLAAVVIAIRLPLLQGSLPVAVAVAATSGLLSFAVTTPQQQTVIALAPDAGPVVTSLYQSALYLAVSASGAVGALVVDGWGGAWIGPLAAAFVLTAALLTHVVGRTS